MSVSHEQVRHIAKLARIGMSDAEIGALVPELNNILGWVEQLGEVNTDGVEPLTAVIEQKLRLRDDIVNDVLGAQAVGLTGVLVRTGKFRPADLERGAPDRVIDSIAELPSLIERSA